MELRDDLAKIIETLEPHDKYKYLRLEVLERIETLKEEITDMGIIIKEEMLHEDKKDEELEKLKEKLKNLEQQIVHIIE